MAATLKHHVHMRRALLLLFITMAIRGNANPLAVPVPLSMHDQYGQKSESHFNTRLQHLDTLTTPDDIAAYQRRLRDFMRTALGDFPERSPLNPRIVGRGTGTGHRYEKIIFESQPGLYVTAILYLPLTPAPFPGVIVPCGHSDNGKAHEAYQRACILLAQHGIAALCYDPIGQGERYFYLTADGKPEVGATQEHTLLGVGAILTGTNIAAYRIWDGIRALDYLASRPEIDPARLGCTGNSGGGTLTSYLMALDERIQCAAVSCYLTTFERLLATIGPQDAEQNIFAQIANGLDQADYVLMRAPKPTLICAATEDFFDIEGTWHAVREAKRVYAVLGHSERVDIVEAPGRHGFNKTQREAMVRWMRRWLLQKDDPITESDFPIHTDAELQCSPEGQVIWMDGARTVIDLNRERAERLRIQREPAWNLASLEGRRRIVARTIGYPRPAGQLPAAATTNGSARIEMHLIGYHDDSPDAPEDNRHDLRARLMLHLDANIAARIAATSPPADPGTGPVAVEETIAIAQSRLWPNDRYPEWGPRIGRHWQSFFRAYLLGDNHLRLWTQDIVEMAVALRDRFGNAGLPLPPIILHAKGWMTIPALHAAALEPGLFTELHLDEGIPAWEAVVAAPRAKQQLLTAVHGVLRHYDLPDLPPLCPNTKIITVNPIIPEF